jgi:hypothetical protein
MGIPEEHPCILMPTDKGHFGDGKTQLKEPADGLMPEVVEPKVLHPGFLPNPVPSQPNRIGRYKENMLFRGVWETLRSPLRTLQQV